MRKFKRFLVKVIVIGTLLFAILNIIPKTNPTPVVDKQVEKQVETEIYTRADIDINKYLLADNIQNGKAMISQVDNDIEYLLLTIEGNYMIKHDSTPEGNAWTEWAVDSTLQINLKYQATYTVPTSKLTTYMDNTTVKVEYDIEDIKVKSVEITQYNVSEERNLFGKKYTKVETIALIEMAQIRIRDALQDNNEMIAKSQKNLQSHLKNIGRQFGIHSINFNNQYIEHIAGYEYIDNGNVTYGHPNEKMTKDIEYIVVHSTSNQNVDALAHEKWLNNDPRSNAVHYYIDDTKIINTLDANMISWGTGNDYNLSSIQLEICEFTDTDRQLKAIDNTSKLISMLQEEYPNAELVMHKELSDYDKKCPSLVYGNNALFTEIEFINLLNKN